jgi:hypothetical protein
VLATFDEWGIDTTGLVIGDGSGLSLDNRVTCTTMIEVLQRVGYDSPVGQGLAIGGQTGTLVDAFVDTPVAGRIRGKTGTLMNIPFDQDPPAVKALSGYLPVDGGEAIEYVLILNGGTDHRTERVPARLGRARHRAHLVPGGRQPGRARTAMTRPVRQRTRRAAPLGVLVAGALVPVVAFGGVWQYAEANVPPPTTTTTTTLPPEPAPELTTDLMSFRRHPLPLAEAAAAREAEAALADQEAAVLELVGEGSCVRIVDGTTVVLADDASTRR